MSILQRKRTTILLSKWSEKIISIEMSKDKESKDPLLQIERNIVENCRDKGRSRKIHNPDYIK